MDVEYCEVCGNEVKVMAFRLTGVCSGNCQKNRDEPQEEDE